MRLLETIRRDLIKQQEVVKREQKKLDLLTAEYTKAIDLRLDPIKKDVA